MYIMLAYLFSRLINMEKQCNKCGTPKGLDEFYNNKKSPDGKENTCKECRKAKKQGKEIRGQEEVDVPTVEPLDPERPIIDEISMFKLLREKHQTHITLSFHPHLNGYALQMREPRFHKEGKSIEELINEALSLAPARHIY